MVPRGTHTIFTGINITFMPKLDAIRVSLTLVELRYIEQALANHLDAAKAKDDHPLILLNLDLRHRLLNSHQKLKDKLQVK